MGKRRRQRSNRSRRGQSVHAAEAARSDRQEHSQPVDNGPPERRGPRFLLTAVVLLGILSVYLLGAHRLASTRSVWSPDSGARLIQVQSVADHWPDWSILYPAEALDPAHENSPLSFFEYRHEGRSYIVYSFLFALISAVFLGAFGFLGLALTPILGGLGTSLAVFGLSRQLRFRFPLAPMVLVALATPVALYSMVFWEHSLTTGLAAGALYFAVRAVSAGRSAFWFAAGATAGCSIWFHEVLVPYPFALALGAIWVHRRKAARPLVALLGGVALLVLPLAFLNNAIYGTPLGPHLVTVRLGSTTAALGYLLKPWEMTLGAFFTLFGWGDSNPQAAGALARMFADPSWSTRWELGVSLLMALPVLIWFGLATSTAWHRGWRRRLSILMFVGMLGSSTWVLLHPDPAHSLFLVAPFLALAFATPLRRTSDERDTSRLARQLLAVVTAAYTLAVLFAPVLGGTEWGSRYLLATVPALVVLAWSAVERLLPEPGARATGSWEPGAKPLLVGMALLVIAALALQFRGYRVIHNMHRQNRELADAVVQTRDPVILTGVWWIATAAAPVYPERQFLYYGRDPSRTLTPLLERMRVDGVERFTWIGRSPPEIAEQATDAGYAPLVPTLTRAAYDLYRMQYVSFERLLEETAPPRK